MKAIKASELEHKSTSTVGLSSSADEELTKEKPISKPVPRFIDLLSTALGKKQEELHFYKSREYAAKLQKRVLTELPYAKGHSWQCEIPVDVDSKKRGVTARIFVFPDIVADDTSVTTLLISTVIQKHLLVKLKEGHEDCWVVVETEVLDRIAGRRLDFMECSPHKIDVGNGKVNFYQNLLPCNRVLHTESDSVDLVLKVTFVTSSKQRGYDEEEYEIVKNT